MYLNRVFKNDVTITDNVAETKIRVYV